jgi:hypothetical protein
LKQLAHQRVRDAGLGRHVEPLELQLHVALGIARIEQPVFFFEIEECAGRNGDDELVVQGDGHGLSLAT